jgi:MFS superfamily sulfate permease-like transporter
MLVFNAAVDLIEYHEIHIFKMHRWKDFILFISSFSFTFFIDLRIGILFCIVVALLLILRKSTRIQIIQYGYSLEASRYVNKEEFWDAQLEDGVFILGLRGSVGFFNVGQLKQELNRYTKHENITFNEILIQEEIQDQLVKQRFKSLIGLENAENKIQSTLILDFSQLTSIDSAAVYILGENVRYLIEKDSFRVLFCGIVNEDAKALFYRANLIHDKNSVDCNLFKDIDQAVDFVRNSRNALHHFKF